MSRRKSPVKREGLADLLGASADLAQAPATEMTLAVSSLRPGSGQPRREFNDQKIDELAESIRQRGVLQPLLVRPVKGGHEIVAGERRWRAAKQAGLTEVPVIIRELEDHEARHLALIENLQREDLNMVDEVDAKLELVASTLNLSREAARGRLMQLLREEVGEDHLALEVLFSSLGETWTNFAKTKVRILNWPETILEAVRGGLPYTLAGVIVKAPTEAHEQLVQKAQQGASREELKTQVQQLRQAHVKEIPRVARIGKVLSSRTWATSLNSEEQQEVEKWLAQMPQSLQRALNTPKRTQAEGKSKKK